MGLSGVIYAVIVIAWAAYLIPHLVRRHDEAIRTQSVQRFSSAMRVLSRRGGAGQEKGSAAPRGRFGRKAARGRLVLSPPRTVGRMVTPSGGRGSAAGASAARVRGSALERVALKAAAARRRRVLLVLLVCLAVVAAMVLPGVLPPLSLAVPVGVILGFLVVARIQVRRNDAAYWQRAASHEAEMSAQHSNVVRRAATRVDASHGSARFAGPLSVSTSGVRSADPDEEPTVRIRTGFTATAGEPQPGEPGAGAAVAEDAVVEEHAVAVAVQTSDGGSLWDPVPVTLPTYVDKSAATRTIRTIELGQPGAWSSGHSAADSQAAREAAEAPASAAERPDRGDAAEASQQAPNLADEPRAANA